MVIEAVNLNHCLLAEFAVNLRVSVGVFPCNFKTCTLESLLQSVSFTTRSTFHCIIGRYKQLFSPVLTEVVVNINTD